MPNTPTTWRYDLTQTSQDRSVGRCAVSRPASARLYGVDGSFEGGLRPFRGFREVHAFRFDLWGLPFAKHDVVTDIFPIDFVIGEDGAGYGFVYRVGHSLIPGGIITRAGVFVDYYNTKTGAWALSQALDSNCPVPPYASATSGRQMSVSTWGRYVYVFIEGETPIAFTTDPTTHAFTLVGDTGPGKQPTLLSPSQATALGAIVGTGDADRPGAGQIWLTELLPHENSSVIPYSGTGSTGGSGTGFGQDESKLQKLKPGDYAFAYVLLDSASGRRSAMSKIAQARREDFEDGNGNELDLYAYIELCWDSSKYDRAYIYRSVRVQDAGGTYVAGILHLDAIINLADFETVNTPTAPFKQAVYAYELEDKQLVSQPVFEEQTLFDEDMPRGGASWIENGVLFVSSIRGDVRSTDEEPREGDPLRALGQIRWSSLTETSPELFPPGNRYIPRVHSDSVIVFRDLAPNVLGLSRGGQYFIRWGSTVEPQRIHGGYGVTGYQAADAVGSYVYYVSPRGLKTVSARGELEDVRNLNQTIRDWRDDQERLQVVFDPQVSCLFVMNPVKKAADILWFETSMVTSLLDLTFTACGRGSWPLTFTYDWQNLLGGDAGADNATYQNPRVERAFFVMQGSADASINFPHRVWVVEDREGAVTRRRMFHVDGDAIFTVASDYNGAGALSLDVTGKTLSNQVSGLTVYVIRSVDEGMVGRKSVISGRPTSSSISLETGPQLAGVKAGDIVAISPYYMQWEGHGLGIQTEDGTEYGGRDLFSVRTLQSLQCSFTDVRGDALTAGVGVATWRGLAFRGNGETPFSIAQVYDADNAHVVGVSETREWRATFPQETSQFTGRIGSSASTMVPGVRIICADLDFVLLSVQGRGLVSERQRNRDPMVETS